MPNTWKTWELQIEHKKYVLHLGPTTLYRHIIQRHTIQKHIIQRHTIQRHIIQRHTIQRHIIQRQCLWSKASPIDSCWASVGDEPSCKPKHSISHCGYDSWLSNEKQQTNKQTDSGIALPKLNACWLSLCNRVQPSCRSSFELVNCGSLAPKKPVQSVPVHHS